MAINYVHIYNLPLQFEMDNFAPNSYVFPLSVSTSAKVFTQTCCFGHAAFVVIKHRRYLPEENSINFVCSVHLKAIVLFLEYGSDSSHVKGRKEGSRYKQDPMVPYRIKAPAPSTLVRSTT